MICSLSNRMVRTVSRPPLAGHWLSVGRAVRSDHDHTGVLEHYRPHEHRCPSPAVVLLLVVPDRSLEAIAIRGMADSGLGVQEVFLAGRSLAWQVWVFNDQGIAPQVCHRLAALVLPGWSLAGVRPQVDVLGVAEFRSLLQVCQERRLAQQRDIAVPRHARIRELDAAILETAARRECG